MDPTSPAAGTGGRGGEKKSTMKKLRLMCSYGGQIVPRPHDKTLSYVGGETRLILSDRHVSLHELTTRLSKTLLAGKPFSLKYQLPSEDLDSLISVTTAEDFDNMLDEYDRLLLSSSQQQSSSLSGSGSLNRIRLFLFTPDSFFKRSVDHKSPSEEEEWFLNALNNGIPQSASSVNSLLGLVGDSDPTKTRPDVVDSSVPSSPVMDTSSSFGSTSSSSPALAMANLPPIKVHVVTPPLHQQMVVVASTMETPVAVVRVPADLVSPDSLSSDSSLTNPLSRQRNMIYQNPSLQIQNQNPPASGIPTPVDPKLSDSSPPYVLPTQIEQHFQQLNPHHHQQQLQQQQAHYIQSGSQYIPQGAVPPSAYYIVYPPQQQYPSSYVSARPAQQTYNIQSSYAPPSMGSSQNPPQFMGYPPIHHQSHQSVAPSSSAATGNFTYDFTDPMNPRVPYTQQMAPQMAVQYQNTPPVLSEASAQVPNESFKHQNRTAQS